MSMIGEFLGACVDTLGVHLVPVCKDSTEVPITSLNSSQSAIMSLWSQWIRDIPQCHEVTSFKLGLVAMLQNLINSGSISILRWIILQDGVRDMLLLDDKTQLLKASFWEQCLMSCDLSLCRLFDHLPKPEISPTRINLLAPIVDNFYDYAIFTHDPEWIDFVSHWFAPTPQKSLHHLVQYLCGSIDNPLPTDICPKEKMSHALVFHLLDSQSHMEYPPILIDHKTILAILERMDFTDTDEFYCFLRKLWKLMSHTFV
jgi:hypothetical protein